MAPHSNGQGPRRKRRKPWCSLPVGASSAPCRRFSSTTVAQPISPNTARLASSAGPTPQACTIEVAGNDGKANHQSAWWVAVTEPMMKNSKVTSMRALPPPTVNSVPDAQPPPSCMPMPKMNAPNTTDTPAGATSPLTGLPNRLPADSAGKNSSTARVSMTICARRPAPRRSLMNTRQAEVKPKAA
ncbi:hypothetical protein D3C81_1286900 [compost metagenome]